MLLKNKKANKIAKMRMASAYQHLKANDIKSFYDAVARALLGYLGDKLNIPISELTKDRIREALFAKQISETHVNLLTNTLNTCEMALFAPSSDATAIETIYKDTIKLIASLEGELK